MRLLRSRDYALCARHSMQRSGRYLQLQIRKKQPSLKLGITVTRKYGKATKRNRFKRLMREAFRLLQHDLPKDLHLNIRPTPQAYSATLSDIQQELLDLTSNLS